MSNEVKILIGIAVATIALVIGAAFLVGGKSDSTQNATKLTTEQTTNLVREDSHAKGKSDAKVTIVEFGDFQCPACAATHPVVESLLDEYGDQVYFVFRHYPLPMHKHAQLAANAAEAAGAQGKFFEMYDALFQNQPEWENSNDALKLFEGYATNIGLDIEQFKTDIEKKTFADKIQQDVTDGNIVGVQATPTFFINGEEIRGGLPYDEFKTKIDAILAKE